MKIKETKVLQEQRLKEISSKIEEKETTFDNIMKFDKQIKGVSGLGKHKRFSKKIELEKGNHTIPLELESNMIGGMYFYRFLHQQAEKSTEWQKLQILE